MRFHFAAVCGNMYDDEYFSSRHMFSGKYQTGTELKIARLNACSPEEMGRVLLRLFLGVEVFFGFLLAVYERRETGSGGFY